MGKEAVSESSRPISLNPLVDGHPVYFATTGSCSCLGCSCHVASCRATRNSEGEAETCR